MVQTVELLHQIRERLLTEPFLRIPASLEEYESVADERDLKIEYHNEEIIATMGRVTPVHSVLGTRLIKILSNYYDDLENENFWVLDLILRHMLIYACTHVNTIVGRGLLKIMDGDTCVIFTFDSTSTTMYGFKISVVVPSLILISPFTTVISG